jgi:beta-galactosidase
MVKALRRIAKTNDTPPDPGYEALPWDRRQVLFHDWNPDNAETHDENVEISSNAGEVELYLNGTSLGKMKTRADAGALNWKVPYQPGILKAVARTDGREVATDTLRTAGAPARIGIASDRTSLGTGFDDVANLEVSILDKDGTVVPGATPEIRFDTSGPAKLIAVDSGNVTSTEPFQSDRRRAFEGRVLAIVRATAAGKITLKASVDGLPPASVEIDAR